MQPKVLATIVTTTSYGTWLPGDTRGYVDKGQILPADSRRLEIAKSLLSKRPVCFTDSEQTVLFETLLRAGEEFGYGLTDVSIESWHVHWIVAHGYDPVAKMVGRLKNRMRQALNRGRIWTKGYCHRCLYTPEEIATCRQYIARHAGCRMLDGKPLRR